jgi:ribosomal protein S18 acetylase RimI-like enzyme
MENLTVTLRTATAEDHAFLGSLFAADRHKDFAPLGEPTATQLIESQFDLQYFAYHDRFDSAGDHIIMVGSEPIGRIWVNSDGDAWHLVDIAILPEHRRHGVASTLLRDLIEQAEANAATVTLDVRSDNLGAQRLYFRLGFVVIESADSTNNTDTTGSDLRLSLRPSSVRRAGFNAFRHAVLANPELQAHLRSAGRDEFAVAVVKIANELGYPLDSIDVENAKQDARMAWLSRWI